MMEILARNICFKRREDFTDGTFQMNNINDYMVFPDYMVSQKNEIVQAFISEKLNDFGIKNYSFWESFIKFSSKEDEAMFRLYFGNIIEYLPSPPKVIAPAHH